MMYQGIAQSIQIFNFAKSRETPKTIPLRWDFSTDTDVDVNMSQDRAMARFEEIRSMYFDCSGCASDVVFSCIQTGQRIILKAGKQGYRNVLVSLGMTVRFSGTAPDVFKANLLNIDMPEAEWPLETDVPDSIPLSSLIYAAAQYDVIGRKSAGAGPWEDCTRTQLNIPGLELANTFTEGAIWNVVSGAGITLNSSVVAGGLNINGDGVSAAISGTIYIGTASGQIITLRKARGSLAAPATVNLNDAIGQFNANPYLGTGFTNTGQFQFTMIEPVPAAGAGGTRLRIRVAPIGSATIADMVAFDQTNGMMMFGVAAANIVIDANRLVKRRPFTFATLPAAAASQDGFATITDGAAAPAWMAAAAGGGAVRTPVWSNGAAWLNG